MYSSHIEATEQRIPAKWAVIAIAVVAVGMTAFAWLYWYWIGHEIKQRWGTENALLIARAPHVELWELGADGDAQYPQSVLVDGEQLPVVQGVDLAATRPPGWTHVRTVLLRDAAYDFGDQSACEANWSHAICFRNNEQQTVVLFSFDCPRARLADGVRQVLPDGTIRSDRTMRQGEAAREPVSIAPIAEGFRDFLREQFEEPEESQSFNENGRESESSPGRDENN